MVWKSYWDSPGDVLDNNNDGNRDSIEFAIIDALSRNIEHSENVVTYTYIVLLLQIDVYYYGIQSHCYLNENCWDKIYANNFGVINLWIYQHDYNSLVNNLM